MRPRGEIASKGSWKKYWKKESSPSKEYWKNLGGEMVVAVAAKEYWKNLGGHGDY